MELFSSPLTSSWRRYCRRKRYQRLDGGIGGRKNMKVIRIGDHNGSPRRVWKIKGTRLRILKIAASPLKLLRKIKDGYVNMMLNFAGNDLNTNSVFGNKRIPKARQVAAPYSSNQEFEARLVFEIYKALKATQ